MLFFVCFFPSLAILMKTSFFFYLSAEVEEMVFNWILSIAPVGFIFWFFSSNKNNVLLPAWEKVCVFMCRCIKYFQYLSHQPLPPISHKILFILTPVKPLQNSESTIRLNPTAACVVRIISSRMYFHISSEKGRLATTTAVSLDQWPWVCIYLLPHSHFDICMFTKKKKKYWVSVWGRKATTGSVVFRTVDFFSPLLRVKTVEMYYGDYACNQNNDYYLTPLSGVFTFSKLPFSGQRLSVFFVLQEKANWFMEFLSIRGLTPSITDISLCKKFLNMDLISDWKAPLVEPVRAKICRLVCITFCHLLPTLKKNTKT